MKILFVFVQFKRNFIDKVYLEMEIEEENTLRLRMTPSTAIEKEINGGKLSISAVSHLYKYFYN